MSPMLAVALNGARLSSEHAGIPKNPQELAKEALASVQAGAQIIHLHAFDSLEVETLEAEPCAAALQTGRAACLPSR